MFYLVHVIGYLCQSLFHLLHVSPVFLELSNKIAHNQLAEMGTRGRKNRDKKVLLKKKQQQKNTRVTLRFGHFPKLRCMRQARKISKMVISFRVRCAASQAVTIWIWKNLLALAGRMARPQRAGIHPRPPAVHARSDNILNPLSNSPDLFIKISFSLHSGQ